MRALLSLAISCFIVACSPPPPPVEPEPEALAPVDAGTAPVDAGHPEVDAGLPGDAGTAIDAGVDAGTGEVDAGTPDAGCRCTASEFCSSGRCVADATAPRLTLSASAGTTAATLHLSGTASDNETALSPVTLQVNGMNAGTAPVVAGTWTLEVPVATGRAEYTVIATVRDAAGNTTSAQTTFDAQAPTVVLTPSQSGACTSAGCTGALIDAAATSFSLTATVTDGLALAAAQPVQVRVMDGTTVLVGWTDLVRQPNGDWTWTWSNLPQLDFKQLTLEVAAIDASNNRGTATLGVLYDRVRPTITFTPSQNAACTMTACTGAVVTAASTSLDLVGLVSPDATVSLRVLDGAAVVVPETAIPQAAGNWSYSWSSFPNVDGRFYSLELTATDALRNTSTRQLVVLVDRVQPSLLVNSPRAGTLVGTGLVSVNASSTDGLGLMRVEVATAATGPFVAAVRDSNGDYVAQVPVPTVDAVEQVLTVRATDLAGNARSTTTRYTADRVAPVFTLNGADFDCSGVNACTGSVANRASTQVVYGGTFSDGSAVSVQKTLVGPSGTVASATDPATGSTWSFTWSSLPQNVTGAAYELRAIATDAAGNTSAQLVRRTWLDNVAPTVTLPVNGQRGVDPLAVVAVFSEPMNSAAVVNATSFTPAANLATFGTANGTHFRFSGGPALQHYTPQSLSIAPSMDKAGNLTAAASATFLTATASLANPFVADTVPSGQQHRAPHIVVDADGRFTVAYTRVVGFTTASYLYRDVGNGSGLRVGPLASSAVQSPTDLLLTASARGADQRLTVNLEVGLMLNNGGGASFAVQPVSSSWAGGEQITLQPLNTVGATQNVSVTTFPSVRPSIEWAPSFNLLTDSERFYRTVVMPNNGATTMQTWEENPSWGSLPTATLTSFNSLNGRASVEAVATLGQYRVRFWDFGQMSEVTQGGFIRSATAQPAFKTSYRRATAIPTSASYIAWSSDSQLSVACNATPFASAWRSSALTPGGSRLTGSPLASAMSPSRFVVASEYGGVVYVYSTPVSSSCSAAPVLTEIGRIAGASEPGVTIDPEGKVWVAWINAAGSVVISRL
ncbi:MAG: Ig-like domain-containing protein [Archangium sp.]|nr:Ig-like domain-containing protein [Archangium sp.]